MTISVFRGNLIGCFIRLPTATLSLFQTDDFLTLREEEISESTKRKPLPFFQQLFRKTEALETYPCILGLLSHRWGPLEPPMQASGASFFYLSLSISVYYPFPFHQSLSIIRFSISKCIFVRPARQYIMYTVYEFQVILTFHRTINVDRSVLPHSNLHVFEYFESSKNST